MGTITELEKEIKLLKVDLAKNTRSISSFQILIRITPMILEFVPIFHSEST
jgi:hypothetical protein